MDHIGIDVHQKDSQICILGAEGALSEPRVRTTPIGSPTSSAPPRGGTPPEASR